MDQKAKLMKTRRMSFIKVLLKLRNSLSINAFFFYFAALFKLLGTFIQSHQFDICHNFSLGNFIRKFTVCHSSDPSCIDFKNYDLICLLLYIVILLPAFFVVLSFKIEKNKNSKLVIRQKKLLLFCSIDYLVVLFSTQHLIEFFSLPIFALINSDIYSSNGVNHFKNFRDNLFSKNIYLVLSLNCIMIIYLNGFTFYYIELLNTPFFSQVQTIQIYQNKSFIVFVVLLCNFQALQSLGIYNGKMSSNSILTIILLFMLTIMILIYIKAYFSEQTLLSRIFIFVIYMCFFSCIIDLYIYYAVYPKTLSVSELIQKIISEMILSFIVLKITNMLKHRRYQKELEKILFNKQKKITIEPYIYISTILLQSINDSRKLEIIISLLHKHKANCKESTCLCRKSTYQINDEIFDNLIVKSRTKMQVEHFYTLYKDIVIVIENEIYNMLLTIAKMNKLGNYYQIILLHIEYMCFFSGNVQFGCFLIEKYTKKIEKGIPFLLQLQLYELKKKFISTYKKALVKSSLGLSNNLKKVDESLSNSSKKLIQFQDFFKYQNIVHNIRNLLKDCVKEFINILSLSKYNNLPSDLTKSNFHLEYLLNTHLSLNSIIQACQSFRKKHSDLNRTLAINFNRDRKLTNQTTCYLLSMYYYTILRKIPDKVSNLFIKTSHITEVTEKNISFSEKGFTHPIICSFKDNKNFIITYICKFLAAKLGYANTEEVVGKEINMFLPKSLWIPHTLVVRNCVLRKKKKLLTFDKFIIDKKGYYVPFQVEIGSFPTMSKSLVIVMNAQLIEYPKNYSFIVIDDFGNFLTYSRNLETKFVISQEIIKKIKFNFFSFFNLKPSMLEPFKQSVAEIEKGEKQYKSLHLNRESLKQLGEGGKIDSKIKNVKELTFYYDKNMLKGSIDKIKSWLKDSQTDNKLLRQVEQQEKLFDNFQNTSNFRSNMNLLKNFNKQVQGFTIKVYSVDLFTFYLVSIFEVDSKDLIEAQINGGVPNSSTGIKKPYFISSTRFRNSGEDLFSSSQVIKNRLSVFKGRDTYDLHKIPESGSIGGGTKTAGVKGGLLGMEMNNSSLFNLPNISSNNQNNAQNYLAPVTTSGKVTVSMGTYSLMSAGGSGMISGSGLGINNIALNANPNNLLQMPSPTRTRANSSRKKEKRKPSRRAKEEEIMNALMKRKRIKKLFNEIEKGSKRTSLSKFILALCTILTLAISIIYYPVVYIFVNKGICIFKLMRSVKSLHFHFSTSSSTVFSMCMLRNRGTLDDMYYRNMLTYESNEILKNFNVMQHQLNKISDPKLHNFFDKDEDYQVLKVSWLKYNKTSSLIEEILFFHYSIDRNSRDQETICHFGGEFVEDEKTEVSNMDKIFYFVTKNTITKIAPLLLEIFEEVKEIGRKGANNILMMNISFLVLYLFIYSIFLVIYYVIFHHLIQGNFNMTNILITEKDDTALFGKLNLFKEILADFTFRKCEEYEKFIKPPRWKERRGAVLEGLVREISVSPSNTPSLVLTGSTSTNNNSSITMNTTSEGLLLNKPIVKKITKREKDHHGSNQSSTTRVQSEGAEDPEKEIHKFFKKYLRMNLKLSMFFIISFLFFALATIVLFSFALYFHFKNKSDIGVAVSIGDSFCDRVMLNSYLSLVYKITIFEEDPYYANFTIPTLSYLGNFYNLSLNRNSTEAEVLKGTLFGEIYARALLNSDTITKYHSTFEGSLSRLEEISHAFDSKYFCISMALLYYEIVIEGNESLSDIFSKIDDEYTTCMEKAGGINTQGLAIGLASTENELVKKYIEFIVGNNKSDLEYFMFRSDILELLLNFDYSLKKAQKVIEKEVYDRIIEMYDSWKKDETIFIFGFVAEYLVFIIVGYIIIRELSSYFFILKGTVYVIKDALKIKTD